MFVMALYSGRIVDVGRSNRNGATIPTVTEMFRKMLSVMQMHLFLTSSIFTPFALFSPRPCFDSLVCCIGDIPSQVVSSPSSAGKYLTVFHCLHEVYFRMRVFLITKVLIDKVYCLASVVGYLTNRSTHPDIRRDRLCCLTNSLLCYIVFISTDVEVREVSFGYLANQTGCSAE